MRGEILLHSTLGVTRDPDGRVGDAHVAWATEYHMTSIIEQRIQASWSFAGWNFNNPNKTVLTPAFPEEFTIADKGEEVVLADALKVLMQVL